MTTTRPDLGTLTLGELVTRESLIKAGYSPDLGTRRVSRGRWSREGSGLYLTSPGPPSQDQQRLAALVVGGSGSVLCGAAAALLHGARDVPARDVVDVLVPHERQVRPGPRVRPHRTRNWPVTTTRQGWPVVLVAQAVVQAARWARDLQDARAVVLAASCDRLCSVEDLEAALADGGNLGLKQASRAVLNARWGAWSAPEAEGADLLVPEVQGGRLPPFWLNPEVWAGTTKLGVVDLLVRGKAFGGELDSVAWHSGERLSGTFDRHKVFADHGLALLHRTPGRMRKQSRAWVADMISGAASAGPMPPGLRVVPRGPLLPEGREAVRAA